MSYVKQNLLKNEKILFQTRKHWIVFAPMIVWLGLAFVVYYSSMIGALTLAPLALAAWFFILAFIEFFFSEYAITNQRIFMKEGLVWRTSVETMLSTVAKSELQQSVFGRLLGYGQCIIFGFGGSNRFSNIYRPAEFQRQLNIQLDKQ